MLGHRRHHLLRRRDEPSIRQGRHWRKIQRTGPAVVPGRTIFPGSYYKFYYKIRAILIEICKNFNKNLVKFY